MMGPIAIVPTPLPAVTIPFARLMRLKEKYEQKVFQNNFKSIKFLLITYIQLIDNRPKFRRLSINWKMMFSRRPSSMKESSSHKF